MLESAMSCAEMCSAELFWAVLWCAVLCFGMVCYATLQSFKVIATIATSV